MKQGTQQALPGLTPMLYAGLSELDISRLVALRSDIVAGRRNENPLDHPRVAFIKYLIAQGTMRE
jgi:hypothetical protein